MMNGEHRGDLLNHPGFIELRGDRPRAFFDFVTR